MIGRRALVVAAALGAGTARAALPVPPGRALRFAVLRNGSPIGTHDLLFAAEGDALTVRIAVSLVVKFGPIALFRYTHQATERWQGDSLTGFDSQTDDDGKPERMSARRSAEGLVVEGTKAPRYVAPAAALTATHWNRRMIDNPFINTQDGRLMRPTVTPGPVEPLPWAAGSRAQRFTLSGDVQLETWYQPDSVWAGLRFAGSDGSAIHYAARG